MTNANVDRDANKNIKVLVTGAAGYLAIHCVQQLLDEGYQVRGTVRSVNNAAKVQPLKQLNGSDRLELMSADLMDENIWKKAVEGCEYVLHVASPCAAVVDDTVLEIAVQGTLNVLRAAAGCNSVKKVVLTSSCGAVNHGHTDSYRIFNEDDWTIIDGPVYVHKYHVSKTVAEQAAWNFVRNERGVNFKMTVMNPSLIVGPLLQNSKGASAAIISRFLDSSMLAIPKFNCGLVDVDDAAQAHIRAMRNPSTDNHRILVTATSLSFYEIAAVLRNEFSSQGYYVPFLRAPFFLLRFYALFDEEAREIVRLDGHVDHFDNSKAISLLDMKFKDPSQSLIAMAYDMIERDILPKKAKYKGVPASIKLP